MRRGAGLLVYDLGSKNGTLVNGEAVTKQVDGEWDGTLMTLSAGAAYEMRSGSAFLRPSRRSA